MIPDTHEIDARIGELRAQVLAHGASWMAEFNEAPNDPAHRDACWARLNARTLPLNEEIFLLNERKRNIARAVRALMERR